MAQLEDDGSQKERRMGNFCILCTVWKNKKFTLTWKIKYFVKLIHISIGTVLLVKKLLSRKSLWNNCESKVLQFPHCARPTLPSIQSIRNIIFAQLRRCFWNVWNLLTFSISNIFPIFCGTPCMRLFQRLHFLDCYIYHYSRSSFWHREHATFVR